MSIPATESVTQSGMFGTLPSTSTGATTTTSNDKNKDMFLQLLVAQMKYQDPMNPTDSSQFLAQSAQFTALEKMQDVADKTQQMLTAQMAFGASSLVGRSIQWINADGTSHSGTVDSVQFDENGASLKVGSATVALNQITSVLGTAAASAPATPSAT